MLRAFLDTVPTAQADASAAAPTGQPQLPGERCARTMLLNKNELELIEMLRWTAYAGRETARVMRMRCPWIQGGDMDANTELAKGVQVHIRMNK